MWPWEHLALGYLLLSLYVHIRHRRAPGEHATLALAFGTQFPDLVDKPLAWGLGVLPAGVLAHSIFVAMPVVAVVATIAWRRGVPGVGTAFGIGYLSHLPADAIYGVVLGRQPDFTSMFWPVTNPGPGVETGILSNATFYFTEYAVFITSPEGVFLLALEFALLGGATGVWWYDGVPGVAVLERWTRRHVNNS